jgi:Flp pilus assembly protein TadG
VITRWRRFLHSERGQALVETAITLPLVALLLFAMVDGGRVFSAWIVVTNGAREGARAAAAGGTQTDVLAHVQDAMVGATPYAVSTTNVGGASGQPVTVEVSHDVTLITPLIGAILGNVVTVDSTAVMRLE